MIINYKTMIDLEFKLDKPAKRSGGDKYMCTEQDDFVIYIPQCYSRVDGEPVKKIKITISM